MCLLPVTKLARGRQNGSTKLIPPSSFRPPPLSPRTGRALREPKSHKFGEALDPLQDLAERGTVRGEKRSGTERREIFLRPRYASPSSEAGLSTGINFHLEKLWPRRSSKILSPARANDRAFAPVNSSKISTRLSRVCSQTSIASGFLTFFL